jgi:hypothetical protein
MVSLSGTGVSCQIQLELEHIHEFPKSPFFLQGLELKAHRPHILHDRKVT